MLIEVEYENGSCVSVMPETLDLLLAEEKIIGFRRTTGWIAVGFETTRATMRKPFFGSEKRRLNALQRIEYI
jgi:hypothetical protein